ARVLERAGGEEAGEALMRLAFNDADPAVASIAIEALARIKPAPKTAVAELLSHLKDMDAKSIDLHVNVQDPRTNEQPGPMYAAFETLRALGAVEEATKVAVEVLAKDDFDAFMAGVLHLSKAKAKDRVPLIVSK